MKECLDAESLQSYFDSELSSEQMSTTAAHLGVCRTCAGAAREVEEEMLILASAFAIDESVVVPTERLHQRLTTAIAAEQPVYLVSPRPQSFRLSFLSLFNFNYQRSFAYGLAGAAFLGLIVGAFFLIDQKQKPVNEIAQSAPTYPSENPITNSIPDSVSSLEKPLQVKTRDTKEPFMRQARYVAPRNSTLIQPAGLREAPRVKLLPGEKSYLKAIVELKSKIDTRSEGLRPEMRVAYERNLAVVDQAIASSRMAARHDPRDTDANSLLLSAYQSKVELLSAVAGQTQTPFEAR